MLYDAYGQRKVNEVMQETWGHLAPQPGVAYTGFVIFSSSPNGDHNLLDFGFEGLDGNPWTLEHVSDWWSDLTNAAAYDPADEVRFWRWEGTYKSLKNGSARFSGKVRPMRLMPVA